MKFYNREEELKELATLYDQAANAGRMTVLTGRRRVGKTLLALEAAKNTRQLYLFVSRKAEALLCEEYLGEIRRHFSLPVVGDIRHFRDIFTLLIELSRSERLTLIIDEFQEFFNVNPAVYSELQNLWDRNKSTCKLNLICIGSVHSLMYQIFQDAKEPLFGRADRIFFLKPFNIKTIANIITDHQPFDLRVLFDTYAITGGLPKHLELLVENQSLGKEAMLDFILKPHSPFITEGKTQLVEEFGRDYGTYFSILELIASGKTARSEIESILEIHSGAYLAKLENEYALIDRHLPITAKPGGRLVKYYIRDNFLDFWFRFLHRHHSAIETGNFSYLHEIIERDYATWSGHLLERFFRDLLAATGRYNRIGNYWERGNRNEIDLVAINDLHKQLLLAEVKRNKSRINLTDLQRKSQRLLEHFPGYDVEYRAFGLEDAAEFLE